MKKERLLSKSISKLFLLVSAFALAITFVVENPTQVITAEGKETSINQTVVGNDLPVHDPSIIKVDDTYYVFGTHGAAAKSKDLINWENIVVNNEVDKHTLFGDIRVALEEVFKWSGNPEKSNMDEIGLWAPDVYYNDKFVNEDGTTGAYLMYFSISTGQDEVGVEHYRSLIGLASSKDVEGPYVFEDVVVYSGFLNNEGKSYYENTDFNEVFPGATPRSGYFNKDRFNHDHFPNAIDPTIVEGKDGNLHMSYGSWHGGIWVLDLEPATGLPVRPTDYASGKAPNMDDSYFGTRISGGFKTSGEGSYVEYHEASDYYHLYVTYGGLTQEADYNVRFFRSKNINGPYVDSQGNNPKFDRKTGNEKYGDRILGSFEFLEDQVIDDNGRFYSYRVPGHNSVLYGDDGNDYIVFHTRFKDKGEGHAVRVHQLLFDKDGWPLVAPSRYEGESIQKDAKLAGQYALVNQEKDNANPSKLSKTMILNDDKTISGSLLGKWEVNGELVRLTIGEDVYEGYALNQGTSLTDYKTDITLTLRGVSDSVKGQSLFAVRLSQLSSEEVMEAARSSLDIDNKNNVLRDIDLVTKYKGVDLTWETDSPKVINTSGKVTRSEDNQIVKLTASLRYETFESTKEFDVTVIGLNQKTVYRYEFDGTIEETNTGLKGSHISGARVDFDGGTENYTEGIVKNSDGELGSAFKFDGETGIALPNDIINSDVYSVSMWLKPEEIRYFTSLFFGFESRDDWVSFAPYTRHEGIENTALVWATNPWYLGTTNTELSLKEWSHFAFTNDKGLLKVYINGLEVFSGDNFPNKLGGESGKRFSLGVNYFDAAFKGSLDDLMIYPDSALNANEVAAYFNDVMGIQSPEDIAKGIFKTIKIPSETRRDIELLSSVAGVDVTWETSNSSVITVEGKVNQPAIGQQDVPVRLTASVTIEGEVFTQEFTVRVKAKLATVKSTEYNFNKTLESNNEGQAGTLVGGKIQEPGGTLNYAPGIIGDGVYLDGSTGIVLPKNLITSDKYSISLWMNPENVAVYTTAFFGQGEPDSWISVVPKSGNPDLNNSAMVWSGSVNYYDGPVNRPMPLNAWTHMTVDVDGANIKVYFNGVLAHEGSHFPDVFKNHHDNTFAVGVNHWDVPFKGTIDELKILPNDNMGAQAVKSYYESVMLSRTPEAIANEILSLLKVPTETQRDISLVTTVNETRVTWTSSHTNVITTGGKVTPPAIGKNDVTVQLTASVTIEGEVFTKVFNVLVKAKKAEVETTEFSFNKTLESNVKGKTGSLVGNHINIPGGTLNYAPGVVGEGVYLDGSTGILLPKNLITSDKYSISLWMNPEDVAGYTTAFFGEGEPDSWISVVPKSGNPDLNDSAMVWSRSGDFYDGPVNRPMPLNAWTHMTVDVDGANIKVYFNGVLAHEGSHFPDVFKNHQDNTFAVGVNHWDVPFKGTIDELKILPNDNMGAKAVKAYYDSIMSTRTPEEIANDLLNSLIVPSETESDLNLKTSIDNTPVTWTSSNSSVISIGGKVTQPAIGKKDVSVRLKASVTVQGKVFTKEFVVLVKAKKAVAKGTEFSFDKTLDSNIKGQSGSLVGNFINTPGGTLKYATGMVGDGVYLDGSTGILLPRNLITSNKYSISMWLNPQELSGFTTAFFGEGAPMSWISVVPQAGNPDFKGSAMIWSGEQWYDGVLNKQMPINSWSHITVDVNHGKIAVYFNGVLAHTGDSFPDVFGNHNDNVFALGVNFWDTPFKGTIDELKILPNDNVGAQGAKAYYDSIMATLSPEKVLQQYLDSLVFGVDGVVTENLVLPLQTPDKQSMTWTTSHSKWLSNKGVVTRPTAAQGDQKVRLSVSVTVDGKVVVKHYDLIIKALPIVVDKVTYTFDGHLEEVSKNGLLTGTTTGRFIDTVGGKAQYREGKVGEGVYLDGSSGIRLPDNLITGNTYSVSMWMKPDVMSGFSTTFFGLKNADSWLSFTPKGVADQAVLWSGTQWYDGLTGDQFSENQWRHVAFTVHNGTVKVYIDGVQRHTGTNFPLLFNELSDQIFGLGVNYWDAPFKGVIDELVVETKRVMSAQEIYQYYDATVGSDRFSRNVTRSIKYEFEGNVGNARVTGDRIDNSGGTVSYQEGVVGEAVYLNGSSGLRLPDNFLSSDTYSMQMWVKPESITQFSSLFFGGTSTSSWVNLPASGIDGKTMFWSGEQWYDALTSKSIPANRWSHLAVSVSKGNVSVYIDGELEFSGTGFPDIFDSKNTFAGIGVNFWDLPYKGLVDEFEIDNNVARNAEAIKVYYETTKPEQEEFERNQEKDHHFKFDEDLKDSLDETLEGVVIGDKIGVEGGNLEFVEGKDGKAVYLDGNTGILLPEELITSESYSVSFWLNPESISEHTPTFFGAQTDASWLSVVPQSGEFTNGNSMVWSGTEWYDGNLGKQIELDVWTHVAFSVDQGILKGYLDGELVFTGEGFPDIFTQEGSVFALGVNYWDSPFVGALDDLMIFDSRVLSDQDVSDIAGGKFSIDKPVVDKDIKEDEEETKAPILAYVGGGAVGLGAIAYVVKRFLDAKKAA